VGKSTLEPYFLFSQIIGFRVVYEVRTPLPKWTYTFWRQRSRWTFIRRKK